MAGNQANNTNVLPWSGYNDHNQGDHSIASSDAGSAGHWERHWSERECTACGQQGHDPGTCPARRNGSLWCDRCNKGTHCNNTSTLQRGASTPKHPYFNHPSPHTNNNRTIPPVSNYTNRPSPSPSNGGNPHDITQMFLTHLAENRTQVNR